MFPKTGNEFLRAAGRLSEADYVKAISDALGAEFESGRNAAKQIQRWTDVTDRTARNWLNGIVGPNGHHLVSLARHSDAVLFAMIEMAGRPELMLGADIHAVEVALAKASGALEVLRRQGRSTHGRAGGHT
ncbi:hypothetical protein [Sphingomonas yantingensis]|uniref:Uncharacterized protein n=1 Tax=Sphingomonas yantingensis TaxID=1241761 RepID=A0A7W9EJE6_9SPHN|nr:hypothetical protein [Sphingomonas yantingensis]MBB5698521.1 hypothetical protein [Sphingomonas yantingensis]